jgi:hypothetical protein
MFNIKNINFPEINKSKTATEKGRMFQHKRQKRTVHRHVATTRTVSAVSGDTWLVVCANLFFSPANVFKLMRTSKTIWQALKDNPVWWQAFYQRVVLYQSVLGSSVRLSTLLQLGTKNSNKRAVIHLVFSTECGGCQARYGHSIFKPLMKRMCQTCIHDRLISNRVLLYKYGVHFSDFIQEYSEKGGVIMYHSNPKSTVASFQRITCEALDLGAKSTSKKMLFFDKSMLMEVMGIDLEERYRVVKKEKEAVQSILGSFRRLVTQKILHHTSKYMVLGAEAVRKHEIQRVIHPLKSCSLGLSGGPYYSFACGNPMPKINDLQKDIHLRRGMTQERVNAIQECVDQAGISLD